MRLRLLRFRIVMIMVLLLSLFVSASAWAKVPERPTPRFNDIAGHPYESAILKMTDLGLLKGLPDGTFRPNAGVTRAELAVIIDRMKGWNSPTASGCARHPNQHWACWAMATVKEAGIMKGDERGFRPDDPVSHAEAVTALLRAAGWSKEIQGQWPARVGEVASYLGSPFSGVDTSTRLTRGQAAVLMDFIRYKTWTVANVDASNTPIYQQWQGEPVTLRGIAFQTIGTDVGSLHFSPSVPADERTYAVWALYEAVWTVRRQFLFPNDHWAARAAEVYIVSDEEWPLFDPGNGDAFHLGVGDDRPAGIYAPVHALSDALGATVLAHEYTHMVDAYLRKGGHDAPAWFKEGLAVAIEFHAPGGSGDFVRRKQLVLNAENSGDLVGLPSDHKEWNSRSGNRQALTYAEAGLLMLKLMSDKPGFAHIADILLLMRAGHSLEEAWTLMFNEDLKAQVKLAMSSLSDVKFPGQ